MNILSYSEWIQLETFVIPNVWLNFMKFITLVFVIIGVIINKLVCFLKLITGSSKAIQASNQGSYQPRRRNRKAELAAQTAAENIKKNGICMVPIRLAVLFSGELI